MTRMYLDDPQTSLVELTTLPQCNVGSPSPQILAHEDGLLLAYLVQGPPQNWDRGIMPDSYALIKFLSPRAHLFGPPNDEAINGHPLYTKGLGPYSRYEVVNSPWIKMMEQRNSVHPFHNPERYKSLVHYIFTFHDSTFECVARSLEARILSRQELIAEEFTKEFRPSW